MADYLKNPRIDLGSSPKGGSLDKTTCQDRDTIPYPFGRCKCLRVFVYLLALFTVPLEGLVRGFMDLTIAQGMC